MGQERLCHLALMSLESNNHQKLDFTNINKDSAASAEVQDDGCDLMTVSGIDIVLNHKLQETSYDKKFYMVYIKDYMKAVKAKLQETCPERVEPFVAIAPAEVKKTIGNIKNFQYFTGDSMNLDGSIGLLDFCEDGLTPYMLFFKDSLELGKC
ncbi:translationally-controlled tumor protein homolog [Tachysurus fulvidraco]|uniref:translationally-controlled tumor protein homolog n=1 Tax=Tachysurus fulvidraco TaxID=1234273 RepID=UPI001FEECEF8|nr:translationally-controlled tumor protein homolog [Tachysurus fulvidraco]